MTHPAKLLLLLLLFSKTSYEILAKAYRTKALVKLLSLFGFSLLALLILLGSSVGSFNFCYAAQACSKSYTVKGITYYPVKYKAYKEIGWASWYGDKENNRLTASGELFNRRKLTAAHKYLPIPSIVRVTNLTNNRSIEVRVNDRGPFIDNRIIDLSERAAVLLDFKHAGLAKVKVELLKY